MSTRKVFTLFKQNYKCSKHMKLYLIKEFCFVLSRITGIGKYMLRMLSFLYYKLILIDLQCLNTLRNNFK